MEWKDLTILQAQYIHNLTKSIVDAVTGFEAEIKALSFLTNTPEEEIDKWDPQRLNNELQSLDFMYQPIPEIKAKRNFTVNNQRYLVNYQMQKVGYGIYNEAMSFTKGADAMINNLHNLMAAIVIPVNMFGQKQKRDEFKISQDMLSAPFIECYAASKFYYQVYKEFLKAIPGHLKKELLQKGMNEQQANNTVEMLYEVL